MTGNLPNPVAFLRNYVSRTVWGLVQAEVLRRRVRDPGSHLPGGGHDIRFSVSDSFSPRRRDPTPFNFSHSTPTFHGSPPKTSWNPRPDRFGHPNVAKYDLPSADVNSSVMPDLFPHFRELFPLVPEKGYIRGHSRAGFDERDAGLSRRSKHVK